jgi:hypothetical protein
VRGTRATSSSADRDRAGVEEIDVAVATSDVHAAGATEEASTAPAQSHVLAGLTAVVVVLLSFPNLEGEKKLLPGSPPEDAPRPGPSPSSQLAAPVA